MKKINFNLSRRWKWTLGIIAVILLLVAVSSYFISSDYLRSEMENRMNSRLKGYTVHVERAYFHPIGFSLDLEDLTITQNAEPKPPVASIKLLHAGVHWRELLSGRLVADFLIDHPKVYINIKNLRKEMESKTRFKDRGWQQALESIYPLKINVFTVLEGDLTYVDEGPYKPLHVSDITMSAYNIRNIHYPDSVYPSSIRVQGTVFEKGSVTLVGNANFLLEPHLGVKANIELKDMDLSYFKPITTRRNVSVSKGTLSAGGSVEFNPKITEVNLKTVDIKGVTIDYLHLPATVVKEQEQVKTTAQTAKKLSNEPASKIRIDSLKFTDSTFGYVNKTTNPNYRLFIDHADITLTKFSNQFAEGPSTLKLSGKFMGSGNTNVTSTFRPETKHPDFDIDIKIEDTDLASLSDLFRVFGNFDIKSGRFSFFSEMRIKDTQVTGYVKPIFKDMKVTDKRKEKDKSLFHKLYVGLVGGIAKILQNPRKEVATVTNISGPVESPKTSTWQTIVNLVRNAFIKAILPGFEKEVGKQNKRAENIQPYEQDKNESAKIVETIAGNNLSAVSQ